MTQAAINSAIERSNSLIPKDVDIDILLGLKINTERMIKNMGIPQIRVKYHNPEMTKLQYNEQGNFIDMRSAQRYEFKKGEFKLIDLGVSIKLPEGYWGQVVPRSSLYKNHKLIQTNSFGVIDTTYCGEKDHWMMPVLAMEDTVVEFDERVCQFRIVKDNPFEILEVKQMTDEDRGGFGHSGKM